MSGSRWTARTAACASLTLVLLVSSGCRHRQTTTLVLPPPAPVPLDTGGTPTAVLATPPNPKLPEVPVAQAAAQPKKVKKHSAKTTAAAPAAASAAGQGAPTTATSAGALTGPGSEAAAATGAATGAAAITPATSVSAIGALTAGSEQNPKTMQEAAELISSNERRLSALTSQLAQTQGALVSKVRTFQRSAQQALGSGDAEGARTLAMKGKLLLDDLLGGGS